MKLKQTNATNKPFHALDAATGKARSPSVERFVNATTNVSEMEEHRRRRPSLQRFDGSCRRDMSVQCREGSSTPKCIAGTGSAPGPSANGAHGAKGICDAISSPKSPVE